MVGNWLCSQPCVCQLLSHVCLVATPWTVACQASLSIEFSRQEYWSWLPFPFPGDLPDPGIEPRFPALQADSLPSEPLGKPIVDLAMTKKHALFPFRHTPTKPHHTLLRTLVRMTKLSYFAWDFLCFSTESFKSQEAPQSCANRDGLSPYLAVQWSHLNSFEKSCHIPDR